jgi:hypothetical protein
LLGPPIVKIGKEEKVLIKNSPSLSLQTSKIFVYYSFNHIFTNLCNQ